MLGPIFVPIVVLVLSGTSIADKSFDNTVTSTIGFADLLKLAQTDSDSANAFISQQGGPYLEAVEANNKSFILLREKYDPYLDKAGFTCLIYKWDYKRSVKHNEKMLEDYKNTNISQELNTKFGKEREQLVTNVQDVKDLQIEAQEDPSKENNNVKKAQKIIIGGHNQFYDKITKYMIHKITDQDHTMTGRRGSQTRKGKRLVKCSL